MEITLKSIIKTEKEIKKLGYYIENNIIERVDVNIIAHFANTVCFEIRCLNCYPMSCHHNTSNLGNIVKSFIELFDLSEEDGIHLLKIKNIPCRLIFDNPNFGKCVGFGHFMKDKFVLTDDFARIGLEVGNGTAVD